MPKKEKQGVVVSSKMDKTVVVKVADYEPHPKYKKIVTNIVPLKNWQSAFDLIASGQGCKGVIQCCQNM